MGGFAPQLHLLPRGTCGDMLIGLDYFSLRSSQHQTRSLVTSERGLLARGEKLGAETAQLADLRIGGLCSWVGSCLPCCSSVDEVTLRAPRAFGLCRLSLEPLAQRIMQERKNLHPLAIPNERSVPLHGSDVQPRPHHVHDNSDGANGQSCLPSLFPLRRICLAVFVLSWTVVEPCTPTHPNTLLRERVETGARKSFLCRCLNGRASGMSLRPLGLNQVSHPAVPTRWAT